MSIPALHAYLPRAIDAANTSPTPPASPHICDHSPSTSNFSAMADGHHKTKEPFQMSKWLLEAARKRSGMPSAPSKALLDSIQHARDHPHEVARKLREDALKSGRDPNALANWMAEVSKSTLHARLVQRPKTVPAGVIPDQTGIAVESVELPEDGEIMDDTETPSPAAVVAPMSPASPARVAAPKS